MRPNPSLTARLRIGFAVLFALLLAVSLLGVGRLFQIRVDYEDDTASLFQLELEGEQMRSAFTSETTAVLGRRSPSREQFQRSAKAFQDSADEAAGRTGGNTRLAGRLQHWEASEGAWRRAVGEPILRGGQPPLRTQRRLTRTATEAGRNLTAATQAARDDARTQARDDTRDTTML